MTALVWFRNDLRVRDNPALYKAAEEKQGVLAVYVHCEAYVGRFPIAPARLDFIRRHLLVLVRELAQLNIPLRLIAVNRAEQIAPALAALVTQYNIDKCFFNAEYPLDELARDHQVNQLLRAQGVLVKRCHDRVIVPPGMIRTGNGEPYKVFTAFKRKWLQTVMPLHLQPLGLPDKQAQPMPVKPVTQADINRLFGEHSVRDLEHLWPAGEDEACARLDSFIESGLTHYQDKRDFPALQGTSTLSPYLAIGSLSPRQAISSVLCYTQGDWESNAGASCWISELIWREFYQHVVVDFPQVCKHRAMQVHTEAFPWKKDKKQFSRWCQGNTGIPLVDAAMRQLVMTGWMHNRLRMVVAMFLTKNLQIDWRLGERFFMEHLIDGDFAANNGGWQWSASTGTDAAPYFRVFNPISQSERFDPQGDFIRSWIPELADVPLKYIHNPSADKSFSSLQYPAPMVDLAESRKSTIALFSQLPSLA
ncbi:deoxyribodipyrimidine photo-lyase [Cellvibrio japonicus]|uniref:Deoxyribodipyrimidine photo-lyase n=1 Tax=Cellvibrio japonicus (strain Ueda107) TaxID=498211 RepID=B3PGT8_CELJU|nr:deoxyribodipyrimidine photo-lyase [Cellvibrio japonicus]ACE84025.1 deoxyribodipyrimidine photolyase [Cellvibrio japonicus Ueda107]QEI12431.1 deoxyribodipyrimidine photo-lyase [Cellvibrio japonicus]QEI16004.1 deoxyribodipyrimidine photo-lyase [Cellvibrio japonicus]QEI19583.1 deoxyribodipyrimidine photo-lyase [Cellvibrio japonicus]